MPLPQPAPPHANASILPTLTRRQEEHRARRQALLDAALALFARKSFERVTVEEIAGAAAFGKGTVYNYFPNGKEALLHALFDRLRRDLYRLTESLARHMRADCSYRSALQTYYEAVIAYFLARPASFGLLVWQGHQNVRNRRGEPSTLFAELHEDLIAALEPAIEQTAAARDSVSPRLAAGFVLGSLYTFLFTEGYCPEGLPATLNLAYMPEEAAMLLTAVLLDGLGRTAPVPG